MSGPVYLGLRTPVGQVHRRLARPRPAALIAPKGCTGEAVMETTLGKGDCIYHPDLGPVVVVGVERWRA